MGCWVGLLLLFHCCCLSHGVFSLALDSMFNILAQEENTCILSLVSAICLHCRTRKSQLPPHCPLHCGAMSLRLSQVQQVLLDLPAQLGELLPRSRLWCYSNLGALVGSCHVP